MKFWGSELNLSSITICVGTTKCTGECGEEPQDNTQHMLCRLNQEELHTQCWWNWAFLMDDAQRSGGPDSSGLLGRFLWWQWNVRKQNLEQAVVRMDEYSRYWVKQSDGTWWQWGKALQEELELRSERWGRDKHPSKRERHVQRSSEGREQDAQRELSVKM